MTCPKMNILLEDILKDILLRKLEKPSPKGNKIIAAGYYVRRYIKRYLVKKIRKAIAEKK